MNILIVHAHPEPRSFTAALKDTALTALPRLGHRVELSDLHAMDFDPVPRRSDFEGVGDPAHFRYNQEQEAALGRGTPADPFAGFSTVLAAELTKLHQADLVIFTAPVWWYSLPAILKGWADKVLVQGGAYGYGHTFDQGRLKGKRALMAVTTGGPEGAYVPGNYGTFETNFFPVHHGTFWCCGMTVLEPFVAYGIARADDAQRAGYLAAWIERLAKIDAAKVLYPTSR